MIEKDKKRRREIALPPPVIFTFVDED